MTIPKTWGQTIIPWSSTFPRHDHQQIVALDDDTLLIVWCEYTGGGANPGDGDPCQISCMESTDSGRTWNNKRTLIANEFTWNTKHPNLIKLSTPGHWLVTYTGWNSDSDRNVYGRFSTDNLATLGPKFQISEHGWYCNTADHAITLSSGRILLPAHGPYASDYIGHATFTGDDLWNFCFISDDEGQTWYRSNAITTLGRGLHEGTIVELNDGSLLQMLRNDQTRVHESRSWDGGETWSPAGQTPLYGMEAPHLLKRLSNGNILFLWNNRGSSSNYPRIPLIAAVSRNDGVVWPRHGNFEIVGAIDEREEWVAAYPSAIEFKGEVLIANYTTMPALNQGAQIIVRIYPLSTFD